MDLMNQQNLLPMSLWLWILIYCSLFKQKVRLTLNLESKQMLFLLIFNFRLLNLILAVLNVGRQLLNRFILKIIPKLHVLMNSLDLVYAISKALVQWLK